MSRVVARLRSLWSYFYPSSAAILRTASADFSLAVVLRQLCIRLLLWLGTVSIASSFRNTQQSKKCTKRPHRRYIGGLFWPANLTPWRVHFFPLHRHCVRWAEVSMTCTVGSFKTRKQLITAVRPSLHPQTLRWTTRQPLRSRRCSVSSVSVTLF